MSVSKTIHDEGAEIWTTEIFYLDPYSLDVDTLDQHAMNSLAWKLNFWLPMPLPFLLEMELIFDI